MGGDMRVAITSPSTGQGSSDTGRCRATGRPRIATPRRARASYKAHAANSAGSSTATVSRAVAPPNGMLPHTRTCREPGRRRQPDSGFLLAGHREHAIVDGEILERGFKGDRRQIARPRRGPNREGDDVVVDRERAHGSAVLLGHVVHGPTRRIGRPGIQLIVADDIAVDAHDPGRHRLIREFLDRLQRIGLGCGSVFLVRIRAAGQRRIAAADQNQIAGRRAHQARGHAVLGTEPLQRERRREQLHVRRGQEESIRVPRIQRVAGLEIDDLDADRGSGGGTRLHQGVDGLR